MSISTTPFEENIDVVPPVDYLSMNVTHFALDAEMDPLAFNYTLDIDTIAPEIISEIAAYNRTTEVVMDGAELITIDMNSTFKEFIIDSDTYGIDTLDLDILVIDVVEESQVSELYIER